MYRNRFPSSGPTSADATFSQRAKGFSPLPLGEGASKRRVRESANCREPRFLTYGSPLSPIQKKSPGGAGAFQNGLCVNVT